MKINLKKYQEKAVNNLTEKVTSFLQSDRKDKKTAVLQGKKYLAEVFNFGGITEGGYGRTSLEGVTNFKKQFGGGTKFHGGFFDYPIDAAKYFLYVIKKMIY
jgi:lipid II:glycine glycyltransferase (peptidoglycan interpeptide bridge formation enzyme)